MVKLSHKNALLALRTKCYRIRLSYVKKLVYIRMNRIATRFIYIGKNRKDFTMFFDGNCCIKMTKSFITKIFAMILVKTRALQVPHLCRRKRCNKILYCCRFRRPCLLASPPRLHNILYNKTRCAASKKTNIDAGLRAFLPSACMVKTWFLQNCRKSIREGITPASKYEGSFLP